MKLSLSLPVAVLGPLLTASSALAAAAPKDQGEATPLDLPASKGPGAHAASAGGSGGSLVRTFVGLAIVIGVIYGLAWILRQAKASKEERTAGTGLSTAAVVALGPGRSLHLVRAGSELVLVGVAEQGVTPIRTYSAEEALRLGLTLPEDEEGGDDDQPTGRLARFGGGGATRPSGTGLLALRSVTDRLREMTVRS